MKTVKWKGTDVYVYYISRNESYVLASLLPVEEQLFSSPVTELEFKGKLKSYVIKNQTVQ
jgi:hypothetical protein